jgi:Tfp pilus assembly protein PilF
VDVREIGQKLNVGWLLEGSVQKAADQLRISTQLVNATDGYHLWSEQYDRKMDDVFAIEDEISLAIVDKLKIKLLSREKTVLVKRYTENLEAYHLYLRGRYFWARRYEGGLVKALEHFQQAIEKDPRYALAYAGLADSYSQLGLWCFMPPRDAFPRAKAAAEKALEIDDMLAEAFTSLAMIGIYYDWDWSAAESHCKRAIMLNPGSALAHNYYAGYLCMIGRVEEGVAELNHALNLDPLSLPLNANLGWGLHLARKPKQAVEQLRRTVELDPNFGLAHYFLGLAYAQEQSYEEALAAFQKLIEVTGGFPWAAMFIGYVYALLGDIDKAEKVLQESQTLRKQKYVPSLGLAMIHLGLGERDKFFEWVDQAYEERDAALSWLKVMPESDSVRSDPRFQDLLGRMGLGSSTRLLEHPSASGCGAIDHG